MVKGAVWVCCDFNDEGRAEVTAVEGLYKTAAATAKASIGLQASPESEEAVKALLLTPADGGQAQSSDGSLVLVIPQACPELGFCKWDGDGHFDVSGYISKAPPSLAQVVSFVRMVEEAGNRSALFFHMSSKDKRAEGAVLCGAAMILLGDHTATSAWTEILRHCESPDQDPAKAWDKFPQPFSTTGVTTVHSVTVFDCLEALETAKTLGWLDYCTFDIAAWKLMRQKFDASWIIPGEVLAVGEPGTTARNPRFPGLLPGTVDNDKGDYELVAAERFSRRIPSTSSKASTAGTPSTSSTSNEPTPDRPFVVRSTTTEEVTAMGGEDFVSFFKRVDVGCVVRLNFAKEVETELCYQKAFLAGGLCLKAFEFEDGRAPPKDVMENFVQECGRWQEQRREAGLPSCIAVHCKAGLGRTGVMIGVYAHARHAISGTAFHGWARMCRPGAVQTPIQEKCLRNLPAKASRQDSKSRLSLARAILPACFRLPSVKYPDPIQFSIEVPSKQKTKPNPTTKAPLHPTKDPFAWPIL